MVEKEHSHIKAYQVLIETYTALEEVALGKQSFTGPRPLKRWLR